MNLIELSYYLQNEEASREYLQQQGILKTFTNCPNCNSEKIGNIRRDRMKCYKCKKEWHRRKGSFLESRHISYTKFIGLLKLYSAEYGVMGTSKELDLDIKSVIEIFESLRYQLFSKYLSSCCSFSENIFLLSSRNSGIIVCNTLADINSNSYGQLSTKRKKCEDKSYSFEIKYQ